MDGACSISLEPRAVGQDARKRFARISVWMGGPSWGTGQGGLHVEFPKIRRAILAGLDVFLPPEGPLDSMCRGAFPSLAFLARKNEEQCPHPWLNEMYDMDTSNVVFHLFGHHGAMNSMPPHSPNSAIWTLTPSVPRLGCRSWSAFRRLGTALASCLLLWKTPVARVHSFLMIGQSNMAGMGGAQEEDATDTLARAKIWSWTGSPEKTWAPVRRAFGVDGTHFGPEYAFAKTVLDSFPFDSVRIVKIAISATSLAKDWAAPSSGECGWVFDLMRDLWRGADEEDGWARSRRIDGIIWMQGENDAFDFQDADHYHERFLSFVHDVRVLAGDSEVPWVTGLIDLQPVWTWGVQVRQAQVAVAGEVPHMAVVETHGMETDGVHFTSAGQGQLGHAFALSWIRMIDLQRSKNIEFKKKARFATARIPQGAQARWVSPLGGVSPWFPIDGGGLPSPPPYNPPLLQVIAPGESTRLQMISLEGIRSRR